MSSRDVAARFLGLGQCFKSLYIGDLHLLLEHPAFMRVVDGLAGLKGTKRIAYFTMFADRLIGEIRDEIVFQAVLAVLSNYVAD
jgi:hypothetical protein